MAKRLEHYQVAESLLAQAHESSLELLKLVEPDIAPAQFLQLKIQILLSICQAEAALANCRLREADGEGKSNELH